MNKITTAEKFLYSSSSLHDMWDNTRGRGEWDHKAIAKSHIEFAKLHVKAALKKVSKNIPGFGSSTDIPNWEEVEKEILNAYPLELIK